MELNKMYSAMPGSPKTELSVNVGAQGTSMTLADGSVLPDGPNLAVLGDESDAEIILYRDKSGGTISNITRAMGGTTAKPWGAGTPVARNFTSYDHDTFIANLNGLNTNKIEGVAWGDVTGTLSNQTDLATALSGKQDAMTDSGWWNITSDAVEVTGYGIYQCRRFGPLVEVVADRIQLTAALTSDEVVIGKLDTGFRPYGRVMALCTNRTIQYASYVIIYPDGNIHFSKNTNDASIGTGVNLYFTAMFFAAS